MTEGTFALRPEHHIPLKMTAEKQQELEIRKTHDLYWESYIKGDITALSNLLDDHYSQIGSVEEEVFFSKPDAVKFVYDTINQVSGKLEMRNRQTNYEKIDDAVIILEQCDLYVLIEDNWTFYSKFRASTFMKKKAGGWKIIHQHSSLPDSKTQEGENIAIAKISEENLLLQQAIKRRTIELENKNRELAIEAALEKVRALTMAMHNSADVGICVVKMFSELTALGVDEGTRFGIGILNHINENNQLWTARKDGDEVNLHIGNIDMASHPLLKSARQAWLAQIPLHKYVLEGEDLLNYYQMLNHAPDYKIQVPIDRLPKREIQHCFIFEHGFFYAFTPNEFQPNLIHITKRFSSLFEQTYRRYLDLVRAEAQAREAQIEAALEKVRSRSLAMHKSNELNEVVAVLFERLKDLQIPFTAIGIATRIEGSKDLNGFVCGQNDAGLVITNYRLPYFDNPIPKDLYNALENQLDSFVAKYTKEEKDAFYNYVIENTAEFRHLPEDIKQMIFDSTNYTISMVAVKNAVFNVNDFEGKVLAKNEIDIIQRFARVFDQAFTRFLDLQKAEEQAREAKIEAALERVRSRSLAMHHSSELSAVVDTLMREFTNLEFTLTFCIINLINEQDMSNTVWAANPETGKDPESYYMKFEDYPFHHAMWDAWKAQKKRFVYTLEGEEKKTYDEYLYSKTEFRRFPKHVQEANKALERYVAGFTFFKYSGLQTVSVNPISEDELEILERFGRVFEQAYTRFLDLQKAEAQAREAQIETALERVRSRTMGMQLSDELAEVANVLFTEMNDLVHNLWTCGFVLCEKGREEDEWWLSLEDGFSRGFFLPNVNDYAHATLYEGWLEGDSFRTVQLDGDKLQEHYDWLMEIPVAKNIFDDMEAAGMQRPEWQKLHAAYFSKGYLVLITREPCGKEEIFKRFAQVFDQTYTRFLDLQKAEAQAREAHIEAALEKVRSRSLAMHKSDELNEVVKVLFEKITELQIPSTAVGIQTFIEGSKDMKVFVCGDVGTGIVVNQYVLPYFDHPIVHDYLNAHKKKLEFFVGSYSKKEKDSFYDVVLKLPELIELPAEVKTMISNSDFYEVTIVPAEKSLMAVNDFQGKPLSESQVNILKRFSKVFDQAFIRFLDLQKAEGQAKESQKELSLERIRSQVTSMQESSELLDIVVSMRSEFVKLGHEAQYFWHMRWLPERYDKAMTSGDGTKIGMVMTLPRHIHGDIPLVADWEKTKDPTVVLAMDVEIAVDYIQKMITLGDFEQVDPQAPTLDDIRHIGGLTFVMARTTHGEIGYSLPGVVINPPKDAVDTLVRFAGVFDLAYKRFEDLKLAENDLIEIKAARQKAEAALIELKATQSQLIQQEKLASLGQLTAGIAHEIKNPLNFVNNFSEVSIELVEEALVEIAKVKAQNDSDSLEEVSYILNDIEANLRKIYEHGTRANSIVTSMLQHSRGGTGKMEPTDINALVKEFVNLAFHGMRARKNPINVDIQLYLDSSNPVVPVMAEDFSRVILNICNNAFDAMREVERKHSSNQPEGAKSAYKAKLSVRTKPIDGKLRIEIEDNGPGIPDEIEDKILQPFFTTKKGTEGTGLGLSITNDIVKAHGGFMDIDSQEGQTIFTITLNG